jgi:hypothetical protein
MAKMRTHIYVAILVISIINFATKSTVGFKCEFNSFATCQWQINGNFSIASSLNGTNDSNTKGIKYLKLCLNINFHTFFHKGFTTYSMNCFFIFYKIEFDEVLYSYLFCL